MVVKEKKKEKSRKKKKLESEVVVDVKDEVKEQDNIQSSNDNKEIDKEIKKEEFDGDKKVTSKKKYKFLLILLLIISLLSLIIFIIFPRIELVGNEELKLSYKDIYVEPGYNGYFVNYDISSDIKINSNIQDGVVGNYEVNYVLNIFGIELKKTRKVNIVDDVIPDINVESDTIKVCPNVEVPEVKFEAIDEYDGDITSKVVKTVNEDSVLLNVTDNSNNFTSLNIKIDRSDTDKPEIKLKGSSVTYITYGKTFKEPGYTANDNCDGDITDKVVVSGSVGRNIGSYKLTYEVTDSNGNKENVTRKVIVGANVKDKGTVNKGTIYLTFDDGPNQGTTNKILDILKEEGVKATFFVTCKGPDSLIKRMYDEGHTVALHTASHEYSYVYSSVDNYFNDLNKVSDRVKRITGVESKIIRFPGGSSNTISRNYNRGIMTELTNIVLNDGYRYFDWNVDGMDASSARSSSDVYYNVTAHLSSSRANVVLLHDIKSITVGALKDIIRFGKEYGYKFSEIDMNTYMVRHGVNN